MKLQTKKQLKNLNKEKDFWQRRKQRRSQNGNLILNKETNEPLYTVGRGVTAKFPVDKSMLDLTMDEMLAKWEDKGDDLFRLTNSKDTMTEAQADKYLEFLHEELKEET